MAFNASGTYLTSVGRPADSSVCVWDCASGGDQRSLGAGTPADVYDRGMHCLPCCIDKQCGLVHCSLLGATYQRSVSNLLSEKG